MLGAVSLVFFLRLYPLYVYNNTLSIIYFLSWENKGNEYLPTMLETHRRQLVLSREREKHHS